MIGKIFYADVTHCLPCRLLIVTGETAEQRAEWISPPEAPVHHVLADRRLLDQRELLENKTNFASQ